LIVSLNCDFVFQGGLQEWVYHSTGSRVEGIIWWSCHGSQSALSQNRVGSTTDEDDWHCV